MSTKSAKSLTWAEVWISCLLQQTNYFKFSVASTKTKYIKLNTKTQFFQITLDCCIHFKREYFFFSFCFLVTPVKVYKKVVKFSFKQQKIFWVLAFSFMYLVSVDVMDRSNGTKFKIPSKIKQPLTQYSAPHSSIPLVLHNAFSFCVIPATNLVWS